MLTDKQIHDAFQQSSRDKTKERRMIADAIEAEVREQDEALIRLMLKALTSRINSFDALDLKIKAVAAARARLGEGDAA